MGKIVTSELVLYFWTEYVQSIVKAIIKVWKPRWVRKDVKAFAFLFWLIFFHLSRFLKKHALTSNRATSFLDWICPKHCKSYKKV